MKRAAYILLSNPLSVIGLLLVGAVFICAIFAEFIAPYPDHAGAVINFAFASKPPSAEYLLGTDVVGRDILSRIIYAYQVALGMGLVVLLIAPPIGVAFGLIAGYIGGWTDFVLMRVSDIFLSIPPLVLALAIMGLLEPTLFNAMLAITAMWWPWYARLVYNITRGEKVEGYVLAAEVIGASKACLLYTSPSPRDRTRSRMPSSA